MTEAVDVDTDGQILSGSIGKVVQLGIGFVGVAIAANLIDKSDFGYYFFILSIITLIDAPVEGVANGGMKRFSESLDNRGEILGILLIVGGVGAVFYSTILYIGNLYIPNINFRDIGPYILGFVILWILYNSILVLVSGIGRSGTKIWINAIRNVVEKVLWIGLLWIGGGVAMMFLGTIVSLLVCIPAVLYIVNTRPRFPSIKTARSVWEFSRYGIPQKVVAKTTGSFDQFLLGFIFATAVVSEYELSLKLVLPSMIVAGSITESIMPQVSNMHEHGENIGEFVTRMVSLSSILSIPIFFGSIVVGEDLAVVVFGPQYQGVGIFVVLLAACRIFLTQSTILSNVVNGLDFPKIVFRISATTAILNILGGIGLALIMGPVGVVIATLVTQALRYVMYVSYLGITEHEIKFSPRALRLQVVAGISMFPFVSIGSSLLKAGYGTALGIGLGAVSYFLVLLVISNSFRMTTNEVLRRYGFSIND